MEPYLKPLKRTLEKSLEQEPVQALAPEMCLRSAFPAPSPPPMVTSPRKPLETFETPSEGGAVSLL